MTIVLDASALLAIIFEERGGEIALDAAARGTTSTVNFSEALAKASDKNFDPREVRVQLLRAGLTLVPFSDKQALLAASLRPATRKERLSFADRACLALATDLDLPVLTGDRVWSELDVGLDIQMIR